MKLITSEQLKEFPNGTCFIEIYDCCWPSTDRPTLCGIHILYEKEVDGESCRMVKDLFREAIIPHSDHDDCIDVKYRDVSTAETKMDWDKNSFTLDKYIRYHDEIIVLERYEVGELIATLNWAINGSTGAIPAVDDEFRDYHHVQWAKCQLLGIGGMFCPFKRIDVNTIPMGLYKYELFSDDLTKGAKRVNIRIVNGLYGTVITEKPIRNEIPRKGIELSEGDFKVFDMNAMEV